MGEKNTIEVRVHGKEYAIRGEEAEEYIHKLANYIDKKMAEISKTSVRMSTASTAILTCMNLADEYFKLQDSISGIKNELEQNREIVKKQEDEINDLKVKYTQTQLELAKAKSKIEEISKQKKY